MAKKISKHPDKDNMLLKEKEIFYLHSFIKKPRNLSINQQVLSIKNETFRYNFKILPLYKNIYISFFCERIDWRTRTNKRTAVLLKKEHFAFEIIFEHNTFGRKRC